MRIVALLTAALIATPAVAGPLSKFDGKPPSLTLSTATALPVVERCLVDADLAPFVYRQPDRPDDVTLIWTIGNGVAISRVDLHQAAGATSVKAWNADKQAKKCAASGAGQ